MQAGVWFAGDLDGAAAAELGLLGVSVAEDAGGLGLGLDDEVLLFREMGRSPVGARVFNCDAPDQGNMDLLLNHASDASAPATPARITDGCGPTART